MSKSKVDATSRLANCSSCNNLPAPNAKMPLGFERINERTTRPNALINFIKPLQGATSATAHELLSRIAAQCYPVMKKNYLAVMALEEYPWNTEFIGRNFNAGEVIQLVLRSKSGQWLPFKHVQMVMMHELAHCKQMNHSRDFWKVRNGYAEEMKGLWVKNYLGEGLWGKGQALEDGRFMGAEMPLASDMPEHMCGGTYRRRGRKRKRNGNAENGTYQLSYAEKKQRRILKKFGAGGVALGDDEETRVKLEDGKKPKGKPRVAGSNRGRELRAAAALARFDTIKTEEVKKEEDDGSDTEDEYDWPPTDNDEASVSRDWKSFIRVCEAEDEDNDDVKREMEELYDLSRIPKAPSRTREGLVNAARSVSDRKTTIRHTQPWTYPTAAEALEGFDTESEPDRGAIPLSYPVLSKGHPQSKSSTASNTKSTIPATISSTTIPIKPQIARTPTIQQSNPALEAPLTSNDSNSCAVCSLSNDASALICVACSHVLDTTRTSNHWKCASAACQGGIYVNMGDYGRCQVCGASKPP